MTDFRQFLASARLPGYRPATLGEAHRLLYTGLGEAALYAEQQRRLEQRDVNDLDAAYRQLVAELAGIESLEDTETAAGRRRWALQRRAVVDLLLEKLHVEINATKLSTFVVTSDSDGGPPPPPGSPSSDFRGHGGAS